LPDAKIKVDPESLLLVASRKAKDGGDPEEALDESKESPRTMGLSAGFWLLFARSKSDTDWRDTTRTNRRKPRYRFKIEAQN
jgi:hypothetical protein